MTINFTGISNLSVAKTKPKEVLGSYLSVDNTIKLAPKELTAVKLRFDLTNDKQGNDLDNLISAYEKSGRRYSFNPQKPNQVELYLKSYTIDSDVIPMNTSLLFVNGQQISVLGRQDLPLYTELATLTRRLGELPDTSEAQKQCTNMVNEGIAKEAEYYIDNIM